MQIRRNRKPFFTGKTCDICRKKASMFRVSKNKRFMLCDDRKCDFASRIKAGFCEELNLK